LSPPSSPPLPPLPPPPVLLLLKHVKKVFVSGELGLLISGCL